MTKLIITARTPYVGQPSQRWVKAEVGNTEYRALVSHAYEENTQIFVLKYGEVVNTVKGNVYPNHIEI